MNDNQVPFESRSSGEESPRSEESNCNTEIGQPAGELDYVNPGKDDSGCVNPPFAWFSEAYGGVNYNNNNKANNSFYLRACSRVPAKSDAVYGIPFSDIVDAWIECEKKKKRTNSGILFRWHAPRDLMGLWDEMRMGRYEPRASSVFMVHYPVLREVWAGAFRDRIVHHWEAARFDPILQDFIKENGDRSYNCRTGYGSQKAVERFVEDLENATCGWSRDDCYIVGGDFANFFMAIDKKLLWEKLESLMRDKYEGEDLELLLYMMRTTLMHRCTDKYVRKSPESEWQGLPERKSLFHMDGMPIGNLPSQLWANFIGAHFMKWMIETGRGSLGFILFVDDFRVLVRDRDDAKNLVKEIKDWLADNLHVTLHPNKTTVQHCKKGSKMVGAVVKPGRIYISNRTRGRFVTKIRKFNIELAPEAMSLDRAARRGDAKAERELGKILTKIRATVNSYLGMMSHYSSYNIRKRICVEMILPSWGRWLYFPDGFSKCVLKYRNNPSWYLGRKLKKRKYAARLLRPTYLEDE